VFVQVGFEGKRLVAPFTLEVFESRMCLHVSTKIGPVSKRFATVSTAVGFVSSVRPQVSLQEPGPRKCLATNFTLVVEVVCQNVH